MATEEVTSTTPAESEGFRGLGLEAGLVKTLAELGYEEPTPIQREAIPPLLARKEKGEPGAETWPNKDAMEHGGGMTWLPGTSRHCSGARSVNVIFSAERT